MSQNKGALETVLVIECEENPVHAIEAAARAASVRREVGYALGIIDSNHWKVTLTNGTMKALRNVMLLARGVKIVEGE